MINAKSMNTRIAEAIGNATESGHSTLFPIISDLKKSDECAQQIDGISLRRPEMTNVVSRPGPHRIQDGDTINGRSACTDTNAHRRGHTGGLKTSTLHVIVPSR